jgi:hypothetical protein
MPIKTNFKSISFILGEEERTENYRNFSKRGDPLLPIPLFPDYSRLGSLIILSRLKAKMMKGDKKQTGVSISESGFI